MKNTLNNTTLLLLLFILLTGSVNVYCQDDKPAIYLEIKTGSFNRFSNKSFNPTVGIAAEMALKNSMYTLAYSLGAEENTNWAFQSFDVLYGKYHRWDHYRFYAEAGLGLVRYRYLTLFHNTIGIPLRAGLYVMPIRFGGLGIDLFMNMNLEMPYWGAALTYELGKLR